MSRFVRTSGRGRTLACAAIVVMVLGLGVDVRGQAPGGTPDTPAAQDEFVPVDRLPSQEELPAAPLVMTAYAAAWLVLFGYVVSIWRRLARVEREMRALGRTAAAADRPGPPRGSPGDGGLG